MKKNVGKADAFIRFMLGIAFLLQFMIFDVSKIGLVIILTAGLLLLKSAFTRYCPLYTLLGICTACAEGDCSCIKETEKKEAQA